MNSKERVRAAIEHRRPDRVPLDFHARWEVYQALRERWGTTDDEQVLRRLGADLRQVAPTLRLPTYPGDYADPTIEVTPKGVHRDIWGVGFLATQTPHGRYMDLAESPLAGVSSVRQLDDHPWPSADWWDYSTLAEQADAHREHWVWGHSRGIFEISWFLRGFDNFLADLLLRPDLAEAVMDRVQAYLFERARRVLQAGGGRIDMMEYNDDVGGQNGLLISPDLWRRFVRPRMAEFVDLCRRFGVRVRYHCCGGLRPIIGDLIELGVDVLNPVQVLAAGMEPRGLKRDFGDRITFNGGVDTQQLLPRATPTEVRRHVGGLIADLGRGGGFILAPSHVFQGDVPIGNVLAVHEAALGREL